MLNKFSKFKSPFSKVSSWIMAKRLKVDKLSVKNNETSEVKTTTTSSDVMKESSSCDIITYLKSPTKSESDTKEYSVIKLPNGLTALLISDRSQLFNLDETKASSDNDSFESGSGTSMESESEDNSVDCYDETTKNVNADKEKLAACALCIGVGSFSDPENIPGLAHFLEHMIFMGSDKYPKENEFDVYIKKKGGSDNASTECEYTTFYFDCHETHLLGALEIFSQLFVSPLMKRESMTKEREAIESEFQMNIPSDGCRKSQLLCSLADENNPAHKFMWGNLITLRDNVKDDDLYKAVHEFRETHYSAHRMTLAVQARLSLETLEKWIVQCFLEVPSNGLVQEKFLLNAPPFRENDFSKLFIVEPVKNINNLDLTWVLPSTLQLYRSKPLNFLSWIIGHEGKGSLLSYLRDKLWCFDIIVNSGGDGTEENSIYSLFSVSLILTQQGINHVHEILTSVFQYLKMFQQEGPKERLFRELQLIAETSFKFSEEVPPCNNVEQLSENMHFYTSVDYITGMELFFEFDPELISSFLNALKPNNVNIMISSKIVASTENLDNIEPWFGTRYLCKEIPSEWIKDWQNISLLNSEYGFHLPDPNPFIPSDFTILPIPEKIEEFPDNILKDNVLELWYKQDVIFKLPHAFCCFHLVSPLSYKTVQNATMLDLFISILKISLGEELYPANVAQLEYGFYTGEKGIILTVNGYNEKLKLLLTAIIKGIVSLRNDLKPELVAAMKDEQKKHYLNSSLKTGFLARDIRMSILLERHWTALQKEEALNDITCDSLKNFVTLYLSNLFIQCLIQGNVTREDAIEFANIVKAGLSCEPLSTVIPEIQVNKLPYGEKFCVVESFNTEDANSVVTNYYQSGLGSIQESCVIEMLLMLMEEPLFDSLRTKQQLGYDVSCSLRDTFGILGFSVSVHCQSDRNSVESVENRITEFLNTFLQILKQTSLDDFREVQESLIKLKKCADIHLKQEVKRNWDEIKNREYVFDRHQKERDFIAKLTIQEVIQWFEITAGIKTPLKLKKLSTQVVGKISTASNENINLKSKNANENVCQNFKNELKFLTQQETIDKFIFNVNEFKDSLSLYPPHKIM